MTRRRQGFVIVEMMAVIAVYLILLSMGVAAIWTTLEAFRADGEAHEQCVKLDELADLFRADAAAASNTLQAFGDVRESPRTLILQHKDGTTVLYQAHADAIERIETQGQRRETRVTTLPGAEGPPEFSKGPEGRWVRLRYLNRRGRELTSPRRLVEVIAAMEGTTP